MERNGTAVRREEGGKRGRERKEEEGEGRGGGRGKRK